MTRVMMPPHSRYHGASTFAQHGMFSYMASYKRARTVVTVLEGKPTRLVGHCSRLAKELEMCLPGKHERTSFGCFGKGTIPFLSYVMNLQVISYRPKGCKESGSVPVESGRTNWWKANGGAKPDKARLQCISLGFVTGLASKTWGHHRPPKVSTQARKYYSTTVTAWSFTCVIMGRGD